MERPHVDVASLIDAKVLLARGEFPWTFLAFPQSGVDQSGLPVDAESREYIAAVQAQGVKVGIWLDTPTEGTAFAFVGPEDIPLLHDRLDALEKSGRFPKGYAERLCNRLFGVPSQA